VLPALSVAVAVNEKVPTPFGWPPVTLTLHDPAKPDPPLLVALHDGAGTAPSV
jgi:hypothetical protein